jgi:hypothetical protein
MRIESQKKRLVQTDKIGLVHFKSEEVNRPMEIDGADNEEL